MSSVPTNRLPGHASQTTDLHARQADELSDSSTDGNEVSPEEADSLRTEKLNAIRSAIDAGTYDSDEILAKAMERLRKSIESAADEADTGNQ